MVEEFRPIKDFERYYVSNLGRVLNTETGKILKMFKRNCGYLEVNLSVNGNRKACKVHRLVAQAFVPNVDNLDTVDHIDGNKYNNRSDNLQWLSFSDNSKKFWKEQVTEKQLKRYHEIGKTYGKENCLKYTTKKRKPVLCLETGIIYESISQASKELNIATENISSVLLGKYQSTHGLHFMYYL